LTKKIIIAIDGYSSTGKSTLAKMLSKHLNYKHINTGSMYRAVTLYALRKNMITAVNDKFEMNEQNLLNSIDDLTLDFRTDEHNVCSMYMNDESVENEIRTQKVSHYVSYLSKHSLIRRKIVLMQKKIGVNKGIVMEGRDIGSVVFPSAELKLFITASLEVRAQRRYEELLKLGFSTSFKEVLENLKMRDFADSNRKNSPLMKVDDAILIDNTSLGLEEQFQLVLNLLNK
jgi:cytidylate kinase